MIAHFQIELHEDSAFFHNSSSSIVGIRHRSLITASLTRAYLHTCDVIIGFWNKHHWANPWSCLLHTFYYIFVNQFFDFLFNFGSQPKGVPLTGCATGFTSGYTVSLICRSFSLPNAVNSGLNSSTVHVSSFSLAETF